MSAGVKLVNVDPREWLKRVDFCRTFPADIFLPRKNCNKSILTLTIGLMMLLLVAIELLLLATTVSGHGYHRDYIPNGYVVPCPPGACEFCCFYVIRS